MFVDYFLSKRLRLLSRLALVARKRHPFPDDSSARGVLGFHGYLIESVVPNPLNMLCLLHSLLAFGIFWEDP
jgi:hypothetical protein